jgi:hypothetical protein
MFLHTVKKHCTAGCWPSVAAVHVHLSREATSGHADQVQRMRRSLMLSSRFNEYISNGQPQRHVLQFQTAGAEYHSCCCREMFVITKHGPSDRCYVTAAVGSMNAESGNNSRYSSSCYRFANYERQAMSAGSPPAKIK